MERVNLNLSGIEAVIFDMDGTMIDNGEYHQKAFQMIGHKYGIDLSAEEYTANIANKHNAQALPALFKRELAPEELAALAEEKEESYRKLYAAEIREVKGLTAVIHKIKATGCKIGIATTSYKKNVDFVLDGLGLTGEFDVITTGDEVTEGKPNPVIYFLTARKLGVKPENCLVFEDSPRGVEAAVAAGMLVVGVLTTHTQKELASAHLWIDNFSELTISARA